MKQVMMTAFFVVVHGLICFAENPRVTLNLNGTWDFEQTETAFPLENFKCKIPLPGLIDLASSKIEEYDELIMGDREH